MQGIIMQGPSVLATLAGNKTQTRRVIKEQPLTHFKDVEFDGIMCRGDNVAFFVGIESDSVAASQHVKIPHPVGSVRYVKEAYWPAPVRFSDDGNNCVDNEGRPRYVGWDCTMNEDSRDCARDYGVKKKSPLFMPQWASRCHIKIISARSEKLQDISDADVMSEGCRLETLVTPTNGIGGQGLYLYSMDGVDWYKTPMDAYASYFIKINGLDAWKSNPWVMVYDFEVIWKK